MCGIVGCILKENENVAPILFDCISKLEYRGYDSIGLATYTNDMISLRKDKGRIKAVNEKLNFEIMQGNYGIAHTRWASIGEITKENAHPHLDDTNSIAVVHNGTLENHLELKEELIKLGHEFKSTSDTEIIPHLMKMYMDKGFDLEDALKKTSHRLKGSYAIVAMSKDEPGKIVATRKDSPLIVACNEEGFFVSSDIPAILNYAHDVIRPEEEEIIILTTNHVEIHGKNGENIEYETTYIDWEPINPKRDIYEFFMLKEISEQPKAVEKTLAQKENIERVLEKIGYIKRICFVACGTSYHASITGKYLIESLAGIPCDIIVASEYKYTAKTWDENTLVIFISQSGETFDSRMALKEAKKTSKTLAIVNVKGSSMCNEAEHYILTMAGHEIGVAATKTYVAQLTAIYLLAGLISKDDELISKLYKVPEYIDEILLQKEKIKEIACRYDFADNAFFLGRGFTYPTALEGALKLKEISPGEDYPKTLTNLQEVKARKAIILSVGAEGDRTVRQYSKVLFEMNPEISDIIAPLVYIVPLQLLSYYVTVDKGFDPDKPKNLAKVITV